MNILFVTEFAGFAGGIENYVFQTAGILRRAGFSVSLLYTKRSDREPERFMEQFDGVYFQKMPQESFDLTVLHKVRSAELVRNLSARFGKRILFIAHDHESYCPRTYFYTPFGRKNCSRAYSPLTCGACGMAISPTKYQWKIVPALKNKFYEFPCCFSEIRKLPGFAVLSEFMRNNLLRNGFAPEKIHLLHPPVSGKMTTCVHAVPQVSFVGQLIQGKGPDLFLEMLRKLKTPHRAQIAGDGNERENLEKYARRNGIDVTFSGFVPDPRTIYEQSDLIVLPFRWQEPFGLVGAEAAAHGVPVVAFDVGGVSEWMKNGETGIAVPPEDVDFLARETDLLLADPERRMEMGRKAFSFAGRTFSEEAFVTNFLRIAESFR